MCLHTCLYTGTLLVFCLIHIMLFQIPSKKLIRLLKKYSPMPKMELYILIIGFQGMWTHIRTHAHVHMCTCTHAQTHTHTHTHTCHMHTGVSTSSAQILSTSGLKCKLAGGIVLAVPTLFWVWVFVVLWRHLHPRSDRRKVCRHTKQYSAVYPYKYVLEYQEVSSK